MWKCDPQNDGYVFQTNEINISSTTWQKKLQSIVRLFTDDTIIYLDGQCDAMALQHDIDLLAECEQTWQMESYLNKCQVMRVTNK